MDVQLKRGLLEVCVLKVLTGGDSYGYKIIKDVSPYIEISESTLYPILKRLEAGNFLNVKSVEHNGRLRKYYSVNDFGKKRIAEFIDEWKSVTTVYNFILGVEPPAKAENEDDPLTAEAPGSGPCDKAQDEKINPVFDDAQQECREPDEAGGEPEGGESNE